jgi:hypothetical protein
MGTLYTGQTFLAEQVDGSWVYGFAYGRRQPARLGPERLVLLTVRRRLPRPTS